MPEVFCGEESKALRLTRAELLRLKLRARREGAWFRALSRIDRVMIDLTIRVAEKVRSRALAQALSSVVNKLEEAFEGKSPRGLREVGFRFALRLSLLAQGWGNSIARSWAFDASFARFLAMMSLNGFGAFGR
jgi:hypothetical protein